MKRYIQEQSWERSPDVPWGWWVSGTTGHKEEGGKERGRKIKKEERNERRRSWWENWREKSEVEYKNMKSKLKLKKKKKEKNLVDSNDLLMLWYHLR